MLAFNVGLVRAQVPAQTPTVTIVNPLSPTNSSLFEFNSSASLLNSTFTAAVYISTVTNMDAWQVMMTWNNSIINYATVWVPTDNVFEPAVDNGATLNGPFSATSAPFSVAPNTGYLTVGCSTFDLSNSPPLYPVNVSGEGLLFDVNFTIASIPNATQTLSTNLGIILSNPYVLGYLESFVVIYPSTTETAVLAESATMTIVGPQVTSSTVYINSDGSVSPSSAPISSLDNVTYTFTGNISYPTYCGIVVERNNTVIDGNGYTLQGPDSSEWVSGIELSSTYNVTVENANIKYFWYGVWLDSSVGNVVSGNNIANNATSYDGTNETDNMCGVELEFSSNNTVCGNNMTGDALEVGLYLSSNNTVYGNKMATDIYGVELDSSSNNTVYGNNIKNSNGVELDSSSNNTVCANSMTGNGVDLTDSSNNMVCGNNMTLIETSDGVWLSSSSNNTISKNNITSNLDASTMESDPMVGFSVMLMFSSNNTVSENLITNNYVGVALGASSNNTVSENLITNNYVGVDLEPQAPTAGAPFIYSSDNMIYHNNFINNSVQALGGLQNVWDNGYPSGGNYWSDYNGTDLYSGPYQNVTGSDGIGDTPYVIDANNTDDYPLMGAFSDFNVAQVVDVQVVSNSTVSGFQFNGTAILFNVLGANGSTGFCNVRVPTALLNGTLSVFVNGTRVKYSLLPVSNSSISYLYFTYGHSTEQVIIMPEFPEPLILAMLMLATLMTVAIYKKRQSRS
jgi:parallel beta-helix repeat protein